MQVHFVTKDGALIVRVVGELDHHSAAEIRERTDDKVTAEHVKTLIFDFSHLTFMDSSGIGVVIGRYKLMKSLGGSLRLISSNQSVDKMLELSGIVKLIPVCQTVDEAMKLA